MRSSDEQDSYTSSLELPELATPESTSTLKPSSSIDMQILPHIDPANPFAFSLKQMTSIVDHKYFQFLQYVGGIESIAKGLHSNIKSGLDWNEDNLSYIRMFDLQNDKKQQDEVFYKSQFPLSMQDSETFTQRRQVFGSNVLPTVEEVTLLQLMWESFQDKTLVYMVYIREKRQTLTCFFTFIDIIDHFSNSITNSGYI
jgi:hypothetical protein